MGLGRLLEASGVREKVALEHSSKSTKYELEGSYGDPVHEHFPFLKTAKVPRECNEEAEVVQLPRSSVVTLSSQLVKK